MSAMEKRMTDTTIPPTPTLTGSRVRLRSLRAGDADALFALQSDPRVMRYWSHPPWTERAQAVERIAQLERDRATSEFYSWAATLDGGDTLAGTGALFAISRPHARGEIGYSLCADRWGKGYAREIVQLIISFAFETLGLERLEADIDPRNVASCRLVERAGFAREGLLRARWRVAGEITDSAIYGRLRGEANARA
jgi:RimJ/RimL family protein N-acetyltransferase